MKNRSDLWVEVGYSLFAEEGIDGLQVERLARIVGLNKSGFYHYFKDLDGFLLALVTTHKKKAAVFMERLHKIQTLDPDYLLLLVEFAAPVMFQVQAARCRHTRPIIFELGESIDNTLNGPIGKLFGDFIGMEHKPELAGKFYFTVRDMFYARASFQDLNYEYLLNLHREAKSLITQIADSTSDLNLENLNKPDRNS